MEGIKIKKNIENSKKDYTSNDNINNKNSIFWESIKSVNQESERRKTEFKKKNNSDEYFKKIKWKERATNINSYINVSTVIFFILVLIFLSFQLAFHGYGKILYILPKILKIVFYALIALALFDLLRRFQKKDEYSYKNPWIYLLKVVILTILACYIFMYAKDFINY